LRSGRLTLMMSLCDEKRAVIMRFGSTRPDDPLAKAASRGEDAGRPGTR